METTVYSHQQIKVNFTISRYAELELVLYIAVRKLNQRIDISITQKARCYKTGVDMSELVPREALQYHIKRESFSIENVETHGRAEMHAILRALRLAGSTVQKPCPSGVHIRKIKLLCGSKLIRKIITNHLVHYPGSNKDVVNRNDRRMIQSVVLAIQRFQIYNFNTMLLFAKGLTASLNGDVASRIPHEPQRTEGTASTAAHGGEDEDTRIDDADNQAEGIILLRQYCKDSAGLVASTNRVPNEEEDPPLTHTRG